MSAIEFINDESGYFDWLNNNQEGFVINTPRTKSPSYMMVHRGTCRHIKGYATNYREGAFTERDYIKICANTLDELIKWAKENGRPDGSFSGGCKSCGTLSLIAKAVTGTQINNNEINYWVFSPGEQARFWDICFSEGIAAIGWDELGDLKQYGTIEDVRRAIKDVFGKDGNPVNDTLACFDFANTIKINDIIFAKKGMASLLGCGIVTGGYRFDETRNEFKHVRNVKWITRGNWEIPDDKKVALKTLTKITEYNEVVDTLLNLSGLIDKNEEQRTPINRLTTSFVPQNLILYGPPGTGKTYQLRNLQLDFTEETASETCTEFLASLVADKPWWMVVAAAVLDLKRVKVSDVVMHELVQAKQQVTPKKNLGATIWICLAAHSVNDDQTLNVKRPD